MYWFIGKNDANLLNVVIFKPSIYTSEKSNSYIMGNRHCTTAIGFHFVTVNNRAVSLGTALLLIIVGLAETFLGEGLDAVPDVY